MGKPGQENKGVSTPPISSQQAPTKMSGPKPQPSGTGTAYASSTTTLGADNSLNTNQNYMASQNMTGTMSDSQYTSQLHPSASYDKHYEQSTATTFTTMNQATNSADYSGYITNVPPSQTMIMNNGSAMNVMDYTNPMNNVQYIGTMNSMNPMNSMSTNNTMNTTNNPMNKMSPMKFYPQGTTATNVSDNAAPQWATQLFQGLDLRLHQIESQIAKQNTRWQNIELTLQNQCNSLRSQNTRISNIENQMSEMNLLKASVSHVESKIQVLNSDLKKSNKQLQDYQTSIDTYSDLCDDITKENQASEFKYIDLLERVGSLEFEHSKLENTVVDLQCRSMRDNLIFTGIAEIDLENDDDYEDVEQTLQNFLETEMRIRTPIAFHRVHRLGRIDKTADEPKPRPIIAKFERFKDREIVRSRAPQTLRNTNYGVREQFPKVIEDHRKLLYPEAKKARQNEENKVRMVRDKLYVNNTEVIVQPKAPAADQNPSTRNNGQTNPYRRETTRTNQNAGYRGGRVFYRGGRKTPASMNSTVTEVPSATNPDTNQHGEGEQTGRRG